MNNIQKRFLLFLFGCIFTRLIFVYISKNINISFLPYLGYLGLLVSFGFMYIYINGYRKTGMEVFGQKIWWNNLRPVHACLYFLFAYFAINKNKNAWIFLLIDVSIGFFAFLENHYSQGNFKYLF